MFTKWRRILGKYFRDALAIWLGVRDPAVPLSAKVIGLASALYFIMPVDLIPDLIPVLGWLDDIAAVPLGAFFASKFVPSGLMDRLRADADLLILRLGPRLGKMLLIALAVWLLLAATGGYLLWTSHRSEQRLGEALPSHIVTPSQAVP